MFGRPGEERTELEEIEPGVFANVTYRAYARGDAGGDNDGEVDWECKRPECSNVLLQERALPRATGFLCHTDINETFATW
jgi:hypothetical protein